ncbi:N-acetylmuramoyl-L-alanine amidase [Pontivivens insulae]|uniref:N-acetylmuramoyl-L-alanine amidase n=1 Tax=Pontivivens insulae TaxID=1639689 RepID=A0A2R8ADG1_9RHOB|nr:N-acetylmuramoyl-L-alanine amidase [Pontivivens insulae]RED14222.1 methyltransferase family protein [Pontivivens insulae]SPF30297.1 N-acetylmuramoyl-L-alanine amidase AmiD [Pontivivens insulae]
MEIIERPSPNFGERRGCEAPSHIVIHYTAMESAEAAIERLCSAEFQVSAHYVIAADGTVSRLVAEADRAWHAGAGSWQGHEDMNSRSIGIELDYPGTGPFEAAQMRALLALLRGIMGRWSIPKENVIGHSDLAPGRKSDPGVAFDWALLERAGMAISVPEGVDGVVDASRFKMLAGQAGWTSDVAFEVLLRAVRLRHRQDGLDLPLDGRDMFIARWLSDRAERRGPEDIAGTYERQAVTFDERRMRGGFETRWLSRFEAMMPEGSVLDLGCGAGEPIARWFVEAGRSVHGVDIAAAMLAIAKTRMPDQLWTQGDMRRLDLQTRFAGVIAWNSFFHLTPQAQAEMFPVFAAHARPGAPLMFTSGPRAGEVWGRVGPEEVYHASLDPDHVKAVLDENGFDLIDFRPEDPQSDMHTIYLAQRRID